MLTPPDTPNPYQPPLVEPPPTQGTTAATESQKRFRWQLIPATLTFCFGLLSIGIIVIGLAANFDYWSGPRPSDELVAMFLMSLAHIGFGVAWMTAGFFFWKGRLRIAVYATTAGLLIPIAAITIVAITF